METFLSIKCLSSRTLLSARDMFSVSGNMSVLNFHSSAGSLAIMHGGEEEKTVIMA